MTDKTAIHPNPTDTKCDLCGKVGPGNAPACMDCYERFLNREPVVKCLQAFLQETEVPVRTKYSELFKSKRSDEYNHVFGMLLADAKIKHQTWRQYDGHWDEWVLGRILVDTEYKGSRTIKSGSYVLVSPKADLQQLEGGFKFCASFYDCTTGFHYSCEADRIAIL